MSRQLMNTTINVFSYSSIDMTILH